MTDRTYARLLWIALLLLPLVAVAGRADAGTVVIRPGQFDHFTLQVPEKITAGENAIIRVQAYDAHKNLITNFAETGKEFRVEIVGSGTAQPSSLGPSSFSGGTANIAISSKKAERLTFIIRETGATVPVISKELTVSPNKLDHFLVQSPAAATAGARFDVRVVARDLFDNTVSELDAGSSIKVSTKGTASAKMVGNEGLDFKSGTATLGFVAEKTGSLSVEVLELSSGSTGLSPAVAVAPAALSYFKMQAPKTATAGDGFEIIVAAYDAYDNLVSNYSAAGGGALLTTTGASKIEPGFIPASDFRNGQTLVKAVYEKAETIQVIARENNREQTGRTAEIQIANAAPDHLAVETPESAVSGQKFRLRIVAYDRFNNVVTNFNLSGSDVILTTSGTGRIAPAKIAAADFGSGVAMVDVTYDKAESFVISAALSGERARARVAVKEPEPVRETVSEKKPVATEQPAAPQPVKPATPPAQPAAAEKAHVEKAPKETAKTAVEKTPKEQPKKKEQVAKAAIEEKKPAAQQPPKEEAKAEKKPQKPYVISNISLIEAKKKEMLVINVTNAAAHLDYGDSVVSRQGKEWLRIRMKPAQIKTQKSFKFNTPFVGEVAIEEDKSGENSVDVLIEMAPSGVSYDITRIKNTLVVTLSRR